MGRLAVKVFLKRFGNVYVQLEAVVAGEVRSPSDELFADCIYRMDADGENGIVAPIERLVVPLQALGFLGLGVRPAISFKEDVGNGRKDSHFHGSLAGSG